MKNLAVWLDSKEAHIYSLKESGPERTILRKNEADHHTRHRNDLHEDRNEKLFFHNLSAKIKTADQVLILGPGLAKNHFKSYFEKHESKLDSQKIIGLENLDHPTEKQVLATVHSFFKKYDLYHNPI